jgi:phage-related protein
MPDVAVGVEELRIRDGAGVYRTFYFTKSKRGILIPHAFVKKTQKTPQHEIDLARRRLKEMWNEG